MDSIDQLIEQIGAQEFDIEKIANMVRMIRLERGVIAPTVKEPTATTTRARRSPAKKPPLLLTAEDLEELGEM